MIKGFIKKVAVCAIVDWWVKDKKVNFVKSLKNNVGRFSFCFIRRNVLPFECYFLFVIATFMLSLSARTVSYRSAAAMLPIIGPIHQIK